MCRHRQGVTSVSQPPLFPHPVVVYCLFPRLKFLLFFATVASVSATVSTFVSAAFVFASVVAFVDASLILYSYLLASIPYPLPAPHSYPPTNFGSPLVNVTHVTPLFRPLINFDNVSIYEWAPLACRLSIWPRGLSRCQHIDCFIDGPKSSIK